MNNTIYKSKMISRRLGGGDEAYYIYVEEANNDQAYAGLRRQQR